MTDRRTSVARVAGWLALLAVVLAVLTSGGPSAPPPAPARWGGWLRSTPPVDAAFAMVRVAALATGWYLAAVTLLGLGVRLARAPRLAAAADRLTVPPVRRLLAGLGMATVGLAGGIAPIAGPAAAAQAPVTVTVTTEAGPPAPGSTLTMRRLPPAGEVPETTVAPAVASPTTSWTVARGECFWTIADQVLTRAWGRAPADEEIVPYWNRLIEANRSVLADPSNPDLLYAGQTFTVPAP